MVKMLCSGTIDLKEMVEIIGTLFDMEGLNKVLLVLALRLLS